MNTYNIFTEKFNINEFTDFISMMTKRNISIPFDITYYLKDKKEIKELLEYQTIVDSEEEELKIYIVKSDNISDCKSERDKFIKKYLLDNYINNALTLTYSDKTDAWIMSYYKVQYIKNKDKIERKIYVNKKYSFTITENPNKKMIESIDNIVSNKKFIIEDLYEVFTNENIPDINQL